MRRRDVVVVGAGHNGLVAACYLTRAGLDVEVVERDAVAGGAVSTVERWPGTRVDRGSSLHVLVRHTGIVEELDLAAVGLRYLDADPWAVVPPRPGVDEPPLVLSHDVGATCASIAAACGDADAAAYAAFVDQWRPRVEAMLRAFHRAPRPLSLLRAFWPVGRQVGRGGAELAREFLAPAEQLVRERFRDERLRTALAWWAAQSGPAPHETATAPMAGTAVLMHLVRPGRPVGGSGALSAALARRLAADGGTLRLGDPVTRVRSTGRRAVVVETASGDVLGARAVVAACHAATTLRLLGEDDLAASLRVGRGLGMVVRLLADALPAYPGTPDAAAHAGMQLLARDEAQLRTAYADFLAGRVATDPPLVVMTPTATDTTLAPAGRHVVTAWAQWHPRRLADGSWEQAGARAADAVVAGLDRWAPGYADHVVDRFVQTPADLERELGLVGGNVMHLEMSLDALFGLRPLPGWSGYRTPVEGVYLCGASTHPGGGVSGASGRSVARVVTRDLRR